MRVGCKGLGLVDLTSAEDPFLHLVHSTLSSAFCPSLVTHLPNQTSAPMVFHTWACSKIIDPLLLFLSLTYFNDFFFTLSSTASSSSCHSPLTPSPNPIIEGEKNFTLSCFHPEVLKAKFDSSLYLL